MNKKAQIISLFIVLIIPISLINVSIVKGAKNFDSKLQLTEYISFNADLIDVKIAKVDNDGDNELVVAQENSLLIYEDSGDGFEKVWEKSVGDDNFLGENSNISAITVGDFTGRSQISSIKEVSAVSNSTNCTINNPIPNDLSYLKEMDGLNYSLNFEGNARGNFSINFDVTGITLTSFTLRMRLNDSLNAPPSTTNASLYILNNEKQTWEVWIDLKNGVGSAPTDIVRASSTLSETVSSYIKDYNLIQVKFMYNHSSEVDLTLDYIDLTDLTIASSQDILVGDGEGKVFVIQCVDAVENEYNILTSIEVDSGTPGSYRSISTLLICDLNNDGVDDFIVGTNYAKIYAFNHTGGANFESLYLQSRDLSDTQGIKWEISPSVFPYPAKYNAITALTAIDSSTGDLVLFIGTKNNFYSITYTIGVGFPIGGYPSQITLLNSEITDLKITNLPGGTSSELIVGTIKPKFYIYEIKGTIYNQNDNYEESWNSEDLISKGNHLNKIASGEFVEENKKAFAIGTTMTLKKVLVLDPSSDYEVYWDSDKYIREDIIGLSKISSSKNTDTLVIISERHLYYLSTDFEDEDNDKLSDLSEKTFYQTDPEKADTDEDGLKDGEEIFVYGTDPLLADTDGDLISDGLEVSMGTDPLDPFNSIIIIVTIPAIIVLAIISIVVVVRRSVKQKQADYNRVKNTPNLMPQVQRLIIQRLETFTKEFKGFKNKSEMAKFRRNLPDELNSIVLNRLYNFLEYLRLKGIIFTQHQEDILKQILANSLKPIEKDADALLKSLTMYETKYKEFNASFLKMLDKYADWKKAAVKGTKVVEELIKCPKCQMLGPKGSAFCLECGEKLIK